MKNYTTYRGDNYATPMMVKPFFNKNFLYTKIRFSANCLYELYNDNDNAALNKCSGLSYGMDSARLGWNGHTDANNGMIALHTYLHINGVWVKTLNNEGFIGLCPVEEDIEGTIVIENNVAYYDYPGIGKRNVPFVNVKNRFGYLSNIYFGGEQPAPHDMNIQYDYILK